MPARIVKDTTLPGYEYRLYRPDVKIYRYGSYVERVAVEAGMRCDEPLREAYSEVSRIELRVGSKELVPFFHCEPEEFLYQLERVFETRALGDYLIEGEKYSAVLGERVVFVFWRRGDKMVLLENNTWVGSGMFAQGILGLEFDA